MTKVLATYNIKGGVGKTSAAVNLSYLAARDGSPDAVGTLDPQGGSTYLFRVRPKVRGGGSKLVRLKSDVEQLIKGTDHRGLDLLPADFSYRHMDLALDSFDPRGGSHACSSRCKANMTTYSSTARPSISLVSESVFEVADALLVPIIPATLSSRTFDQLEEFVEGGPQVFAFFSMVDGRNFHREIMERLRAERANVLDTAIPASTVVERSMSSGT